MGISSFAEFAEKMRGAGVSDAAIRAFQHNYEGLVAGQTGMIPEGGIEPVTELPRLEAVSKERAPNPALLAQTVIVKLNGGLGTSMGLEQAKSLLQVKDGLTFLDFIVKQVLHLRERHHIPLRFLLMNSFSTSRDTQAFLKKYPMLGDPSLLELMQSQAPKVDAGTLRPVSWPGEPQLEWCPPGHGDFYPSLLGSGWLERLLKEGVRYLFISNSDNLGANLDLDLLSYFAGSGKPFLMEVAERTNADRKGGHLARRADRLLLRESAQCPEAEQAAFQDIQRHRFFNTNNLWIRLEALQDLLQTRGGFVPLPLIKNSKTVDPRDPDSPRVFQLETAMGAAIECFPDAGAIVVPRTRFTPVKTTADLFALRSDAYRLTADWRIVLANGDGAQPPALELDAKHYKLVEQLDEKLSDGVPSLKKCQELVVRGPVWFNSQVAFLGKVTVTNVSEEKRGLAPGEYADKVVEL
jgi:UDP-N-acetylglucosamine pyrophosphorylase